MAVVRCPVCSQSVVWSTASPFRPFCSERCKNIDLGAWASERYAVGAEPEDGQESSGAEGDETR